jgi:tetratricopeptide (TPR) repeat protein
MKRTVSAGLIFLFVLGCRTMAPPHPRALECNELCVRYRNAGELERAEIQCDLGLQFSPEYADLWVNKAVIYFDRKQFPIAKEYLIKALRYNQDLAAAYSTLGVIYLNDREYGKAHDNLQRAVRIQPDFITARFNLAKAFKGMKNYDKARLELKTILEIDPNLADAHAEVGAMALDDGALEEAVSELGKATQLAPEFTEAWLALGNAYMEAGKPCDGKDAYTSCIETDEKNASCRNNIIVAEKKCKLQDKALDDVKARASGEKTPQSEYAAAIQFKDKGLVNDEERAYKRCLKYDPKFALCHYGLFEMYKERSDEKMATVACKNFLKFASESEFKGQVAACHQYVRE